jgi:integrase
MFCMSTPTALKNIGGYWRTQWRDSLGRQRWKNFGSVEKVGKRVADPLFHAWLLKWTTGHSRAVRGRGPLTVSQLAERHKEHAIQYYRRPDGTPTGEAENFTDAMAIPIRLFGDMEVVDFELANLRRCREKMVDSGLCRTTINSRINRIRRVFRWAAGEQLVPTEIWANLLPLEPLEEGRSEAKEPEAKGTVSEAQIEAAEAHMTAPVRGIVEVLRWSAARPSEVMRMRGQDIHRDGNVWTYSPTLHKTAHKRKQRTVYLGPKAQEALEPFLKNRLPSAYLFNPREVHGDYICGKKIKDHYDRRALYQAVVRACDAAGVARWSPYQLRHAAATRLRKEHGEEAARIVLGHSKIDTTALYGELDRKRATEIMRRIG